MSDRTDTARPTLVTVLGWIWIALGAFATMTSLMVVVFVLVFGEHLRSAPLPSAAGGQLPPGVAVFDWLFLHFDLLAVIQLALACAVLAAGIQLLRLRRWARVFLEAVCWLGLVYLVAFGACFGYIWFGMASSVGTGATQDPAVALISGFGIAMAVMIVLMHGVPTGVLLWLLRHRTVRAAVDGRPGASGSTGS